MAKLACNSRDFKGRAPGRPGDFVVVSLNTSPKVVALAGHVIRSNKKGYVGLVVHSWTQPLIQDLAPDKNNCLAWEAAIPDGSILTIGTSPTKPNHSCRCARLAEERGWSDDD